MSYFDFDTDPLSNSFDNWKDFADENPALSRELYGLARYINSLDDPNIETLRSIVEILNSKGIINLESDTPKEDIVNFFNTNGGLFGYHEGNETFTLNFSREIAWDSGQFAISARYFDSPGFEDFRDEAFQLIGRNMQTDDMYLKAQAYQAWQEENQGIRDAGAESRFEPEV